MYCELIFKAKINKIHFPHPDYWYYFAETWALINSLSVLENSRENLKFMVRSSTNDKDEYVEKATNQLLDILPVAPPVIMIDYLFVSRNPHVLTDSPNALEFFPASNYPEGLAISRMLADSHFFAVMQKKK